MRKITTILMSLVLVLFMVNGVMAFGDYNDNRRNYNNHNTIDSPSADADASASATGVGVGMGGDATSTIERGAVQNDNTNNNMNMNSNMNSNTNVNANINENNNRNTNVNVNNAEGGDATIEEGAVDNTNVQGQEQGQCQGQMQGQGQSQGQQQNVENSGNSVGNSNVSITQTYEDKREYMNAPTPHRTSGPAEFNADPGEMHQFTDVETFAKGKKVWSESEIQGLVYEDELKDANFVVRHIAESSKDVNSTELSLTVPENGKLLAIVKVWFDKPFFGKNKNDSIGCVGIALKKAVEEIEGSHVVAFSQGARKVLSHFEWSLGITWGSSTINGETANAGSGGIGVSGGDVGYTGEPFAKFFIYE